METRWKLITLSILFCCIASCNSNENDNTVSIKSGIIKGFKMTSRSGRNYQAFTKIPYAKPPVGNLRFKRADRNVKWEGVLNANKELPDCLQIPVFDTLARNKTIGTDDCLYLSVFTPKVGNKNKFPVMVFIHGGGWRSELPEMKSPKISRFILDEDIVLVYFHYRLGALGFLSTEDNVLPGNLGLKDQVDVIQWVKENIANFGGDPNKITLFGNSAGGASTHLHLISPLSKDLIQGGISQSGVATCFWAFAPPGVALNKAKMLGRYLNCPVECSEKLLSCLKNKSSFDITDAERIFISRDYDPAIAFPPVIEQGPDAFLTDSPYNIKVTKPWIIGATADDGAFKTFGYIADKNLMDTFIEDGASILPNALMFEDTADNAREVASSIIKQYQTKKIDWKRFNQMWTDGYFAHGMMEGLKVSDAKAYVYIFKYRAKTLSLDLAAQALGIETEDLGVSHTDELRSLFDFEDNMNSTDIKVSERVVKTWTNFAKYGYPKSKEDWELFGKNGNYLEIGKEDIAEENWLKSRIEFWKDLPIRDKMEKINL